MIDLQNSVAHSLDAKDEVLYPYFEYLLMDTWEFGSTAMDIMDIIEDILEDPEAKKYRFLDLGCGKGGVSVKIAQRWDGWRITGIDAYAPFIASANQFALMNRVDDQCKFQVGDIREMAANLNYNDFVFLGSTSSVFGEMDDAINAVKGCIHDDGYIIIDDAYARKPGLSLLTKNRIIPLINSCGVEIVKEYEHSAEDTKRDNMKLYSRIEARAYELIDKHPELEPNLQDYLEMQRKENLALQEKYTCVTWVLKKK